MTEYDKEFLYVFKQLCYSRSDWQVWADLMTAISCTLSNSTDRSEPRCSTREKEYKECIDRLGGIEKPAQIFGIIVLALEKNPDQDFLGKLYMMLNLSNHWKGQYFSPYSISKMMAEMTLGNCQEQIDREGWISVCDPTVGGGAMLIAGANAVRRQNVNYQNHILFVGQDIDRIVAMMAYIQISLLGCPGYIVVGNSLTNPMIGSALMPVEKEEQEFWYTPLYFSNVWHYRRFFASMDALLRSSTKEPEKSVHLRGGFLFEFEEGEETIAI